ncbi:MAG: succinate dehydrogenase [Sumerlaeia bacterium]
MNPLQYFLLRRLHSLLGVIPLGVFLFGHLTTNSMAIFGQEAFIEKVNLIHSMGPLLPFVEALLIFIPLSLHIILGIVIALQSRNNLLSTEMKYGRNWAYTAQRWSGWAALLFIAYHAGWLRLWDAPHRAYEHIESVGVYWQYMADLFRGLTGVFWVLVYLLGGLSVIFHFANGLCTFCMTWGLTVGPKSQKVMAWIALGVGLMLTGMLVASIVGFLIHPADVVVLDHGQLESFPPTGNEQIVK